MMPTDLSQPDPIPSENQDMWLSVIEDMKARREHGIQEYGTPLQPFNGRDQMRDAYAEVLDLAVYMRTAIEERAHPVFSPTAALFLVKFFDNLEKPNTWPDVTLAVGILRDYLAACRAYSRP